MTISLSDVISVLTALSALILIIINGRQLGKPSEDIQVRLARIETGVETIRAALASAEDNYKTLTARVGKVEQRVAVLESKHEGGKKDV